MSELNGNGNGTAARTSTLVLTYDHETHQVLISGDPLPVSLGQMMLDEAARVLDELRRHASVQKLREQLTQQQRAAQILEMTRGGKV